MFLRTLGSLFLATACLAGCGGTAVDTRIDEQAERIATIRDVSVLTSSPDGRIYGASFDPIGRGELWGMPEEDGGLAKLASTSALCLTATETAELYFAQPQASAWSPGAVGRVSEANAEPVVYAKDINANGIAVDAEYVYWLETGSVSELFRAPLVGGAATKLGTLENGWGELAVNETHLYWITTDGMARIPKQGGQAEVILGEGDWKPYVDAAPRAFVLHRDYVYWVAGLGCSGCGGGLLRMRTDGTELTVLAENQPLGAAVAVDDEHVYWSRGEANRFDPNGGRGELVRMPLSGGLETVIASRQNGIYSIALSHKRVYWINRFADSVMAVDKS